MTLSSIQILTQAYENNQKSVYLNNSEKYWTKLDNKTLRMRVEGDPVTSKDILIDALTCQDDWLFTTKNIAERHNIHEKKAQRLCTRLVAAGHAERIKVTDPKDGKILLWHYIFFEQPLDKNCPVAKNNLNNSNNNKSTKNPSGQKLSSGTLYKKEQQKETTTSPSPPAKIPPEPPPRHPINPPVVVSDFEILKNRVRDDLRASFVKRTYQAMQTKKLSAGQMKTLIDELNQSSAEGCGWLIGRIGDIDPDNIPDFDELEKERLAKEAEARAQLAERRREQQKKDADAYDTVMDQNKTLISKYLELPEDKRDRVFEKAVWKTKNAVIKQQIIDAGPVGAVEIAGFLFRIKNFVKE